MVVSGSSPNRRDNLQLHLPPLERRIDNLRRGVNQTRRIANSMMIRSTSTDSMNSLSSNDTTGFNGVATSASSTLNTPSQSNINSVHNLIVSDSGDQRPKWEIFQLLNNIVIGVFSSSVTFTITNYRKYFAIDEMTGGSQISLFPFIV